MLIDFSKIQEEEISNFHGGEKSVYFRAVEDSDYKIMKTRMVKGSSNGPHKHENNVEIIYVIGGHGYAVVDGIKEILAPGVVTYCKKGSTHAIYNDSEEDLVCFNVVSK